MKSWSSTKTKHKSLKNVNFKRKMEEKAVEGNYKRGQRHSERTEGVGISNCKTGGSLDEEENRNRIKSHKMGK